MGLLRFLAGSDIIEESLEGFQSYKTCLNMARNKEDYETVDIWTPRIIGKIGRLTMGIIIVWNTEWMVSDNECLLYWIITLLNIVLFKYCINIGIRFESLKVMREQVAFRHRNFSIDSGFHDNLPIFAILSACLWAMIIDFATQGFATFWLVFYLLNASIRFTYYSIGIACILSCIISCTGSVLNVYQIIYYKLRGYYMKYEDYQPAIKYSPIYFLNKLEMNLFPHTHKHVK